MTTPLDLGVQVAVAIALAIAFLFSMINSLAGLNRINWSKARPQDAFDLATSAGIVTSVILVANLVFPTTSRFPISVVLMSGILSFIGFVAVRYRSRLLMGIANRWIRLRGNSINTLGERVLIVGAGEVARFSSWLLRNETFAQAFSIVGMVDDDPRKIGTTIDGCSVIGSTAFVPDLVSKYDIGLILFAIADIQPEDQEQILSVCQNTDARVIPIPDILETLRAQFPKSEDERAQQFNRLLHNVTTDRLTGAYNRAHFMRLAQAEMERAQRYGHPLSVVMLTVDYARPENTTAVRKVTLQVLQSSARRVLSSIRGIDLLGRFDNNILVVLLPETDQSATTVVVQRLQQQILGSPVNTDQGEIDIVAAIGFKSTVQDQEESLEALLDKAYSRLELAQSQKEALPTQQSKTYEQ